VPDFLDYLDVVAEVETLIEDLNLDGERERGSERERERECVCVIDCVCVRVCSLFLSLSGGPQSRTSVTYVARGHKQQKNQALIGF